MSTVFDVMHAVRTADRYPADARFDDASVAPTAEELAQERRDDASRGNASSENGRVDEDKIAAEKELERALKDSFPASDPVSVASGTVAGAPDPAEGKPHRKPGGTNDKPPVD